MTLTAIELPLPPNPLRLANRLKGERELAFLWSASGDGRSFIGVRPLAHSEALDPEPELATSAHASLLASVPRWIGVVPYEARRSLERPGLGRDGDAREEPHLASPAWWRFGAVVCVDDRVSVVGDDPGSVRELARQLVLSSETGPGDAALDALPGEAPEAHVERVRAALDLIAAGQIYQVNLARRLELAARGSPLDLLQLLCRDTRPPYAACLQLGDSSIVSSSPELLLRQRADGLLLTSPIKGTRPRGTDAASDTRLREELATDQKERAELNMIIDVERNDLGRVSAIGSVRAQAPIVAAQGLVWHRRANVLGRLRRDVGRAELMAAMVPSGSVTGAPKVRAMELIARLEAQRRGLYTGAIGFLTHAGEMTLSMAIRTLTVRDGIGHYFTGGGIVADSQPELELEETRWKARQLFARTG